MGTQWTSQDPGAGATGALNGLAAQLSGDAGGLDSGVTEVEGVLGIFPDAWSGLSAAAAAARVEGLRTEARALGDAAETAALTLRRYADEVDAIKHLAEEQIRIREITRRRMAGIQVELRANRSTLLEVTLKAELRDTLSLHAVAVSRLSGLAERRQSADSSVLVALRTVIAATWDVPPGEWPNERTSEQQSSYTYDKEHLIYPTGRGHSARELMDLFKAHPDKIFPFPAEGSPRGFRDGEVFELSDTLPGEWGRMETGLVVVETTDTSVKFTVVSDTYFDGPGSTIEFSIVERDGWFVLRKVADAQQADSRVAIGATAGAEFTWLQQAKNFSRVISEDAK